MIIAVVVLAVGATPALASKQDNALRRAPKPVTTVAPAATTAPVRPSAVWIPAPTGGIKWSVRPARIR